MALTFYTSMAKGLRQNVKKFWGPIPKFVEVTGRKGAFLAPFILDKLKLNSFARSAMMK